MPDVPDRNHFTASEIKRYLGREELRRIHKPEEDAPEGKHLKLHHMEYFLAATRHDSFAKAAAEFNITGSAFSQFMGELEENLGPDVRLFERNQAGSRITPQGEAFVEYAERLLSVEDAARVAVAKVNGRIAPNRRREAGETETKPIVLNTESAQQFRSEIARSVSAAIEVIEERAPEDKGHVAFPAALFQQLKAALPEVRPSGDSVDRMARILDMMQGSVAYDDGRSAMLEAGGRASDRFRELHAAAAEQFTQTSVRFDAGEPDARRPQRPRTR